MSEAPASERTLGAVHLGGGRTRFRVWAPVAKTVAVRLLGPSEQRFTLAPEGNGYHAGEHDDAPPGRRYRLVLDGDKDRPDPASRFQPEGVHGPSEIVDLGPRSSLDFKGIELAGYITYELHVGTFTQEGTFDAAITRLDDLRDLGITAVEIMPVAAFPGDRNWGYDGAYPFAVQASYGGPAAMRRFVDACHARGIAVILDVVYNHLGPEGTYLADFGPYFTDRYRTPWGRALNFDGPESDEVRRFFIESALHFVGVLGVDALRLDAVSAIVDMSARTFLEALGDAVHDLAAASGRRVHLFAESDTNDARIFTEVARGGIGLDGAWNDDFHHALHARLTGERAGYYADFGRIEHIAKALRDGFTYTGQRSGFRERSQGRPIGEASARRLVTFAQNHDQVGNRPGGERLSSLVSFEAQKLAAAALLLSPFSPMLFMGEEHGEIAPFLFFTSYGDHGLARAVRRGRREELAAFGWTGTPPDPQAEETFQKSKLVWDRRREGRGPALLALHQSLIRLRREIPALAHGDRDTLEAIAFEDDGVLFMRRWHGASEVVIVLAFGDTPASPALPLPHGPFRTLLETTDPRFDGPGPTFPEGLAADRAAPLTFPPSSCTVFTRA
ncbi:Malto-oligosyltrehalose trehalohydrolase [Minicystis rosea]|nr:Malto-oligosyltrehalose trehalohydrolase [Minicystis rosea]